MNDIAESRSIAVLRTRLPYTDRRSLSQAWFSALHLADAGGTAARPARRAGDAPAPFAGRRVARGFASAPGSPAIVVPARGVASVRLSGAAQDEGQRRSSVTAKLRADVLERARSYPPFRTALTIGVDGARVKLLVRRDGPVLHVIALCAERNVDLVRRALACADAHLRRSGESISASVRTAPERSA